MRDFDRPLDASGTADAEATGRAMRACGYVPDLTLCSNARRARETLEGIAGQTDTGRVAFFDALYSEDAAGYLSIIRGNGGAGSLLVIGHNPMMEDLAMAMAGTGDENARATLNSGFPTSGLAVLRFEVGRFLAVLRERELEPALLLLLLDVLRLRDRVGEDVRVAMLTTLLIRHICPMHHGSVSLPQTHHDTPGFWGWTRR